MYERFTDRARKTFQLANQEAQRFNHEYIGTEHVLLGLIKEGGGVAAEILKGMKIDLRTVRLEVEKVVQSGPPMDVMGKLPQTPRTKKVIEYSIQCARERNDNYVGTFHILMGLVKEPEGVAGAILKKFNVSETVLLDAEKHYVKTAVEKLTTASVAGLEEARRNFEKEAESAAQLSEMLDKAKQSVAAQDLVVSEKLDLISNNLDLILQNQGSIIRLLNELEKRLPPKFERPPDCEHI